MWSIRIFWQHPPTTKVPRLVFVVKARVLPTEEGVDLVDRVFNSFDHSPLEAVEGASVHLEMVRQSSDEYRALCYVPTYLRKFALCYERAPESVRTVPCLRAAGCDSIPALPSLPSLPLSEFQFDSLYSVRLPKKSIKFREKI